MRSLSLALFEVSCAAIATAIHIHPIGPPSGVEQTALPGPASSDDFGKRRAEDMAEMRQICHRFGWKCQDDDASFSITSTFDGERQGPWRSAFSGWAPSNSSVIPKIIHTSYIYDPRPQWPNPVWKVSYEAMRKHFPDPEYRFYLWNDTTIDELFQEKCGEHHAVWMRYKNKNGIFRSDLSRYCMMKTFGGIWLDLDYEPRANFYEDLAPGRVNLVESPYTAANGESVQNSLMASPLDAQSRRYWNDVLTFALKANGVPTQATGPGLLQKSPETEEASVVHKLPCHEFQRKVHPARNMTKVGCEPLAADNIGDAKGIHWSTWSWMNKEHGQSGKVNNLATAYLFKALHPEVA